MSQPQTVETLPATTSARAFTPMDMLSRAVSAGADIEVLEKLVALHERYESSQARKAFDSAIASAKAKIKPVVRNREGHNKKRYADFAAIASAVDGILSDEGLSYRFRSKQGDKIEVTCILSHREGHAEETTLCGPPDQTGNKNAIQAIGSTLTYLQRYSLIQALGLAAAEDDDGRAASNDEPLDAEQSEQITKLITETKSDIGRFLKWAGAESVSDIPKSKFKDCVAMLEAKQNKKGLSVIRG